MRKIRAGHAFPLGATATLNGTNFAIYAREESDVTLLLWPDEAKQPDEYRLDAHINHTGHVWHVELEPSVSGTRYKWRVGKPDPRWGSNICLDPYARAIDSSRGPEAFNSCVSEFSPYGIVIGDDEGPRSFDWQNVSRPHIQWSDLIIYEMHVRGFTRRDAGGTFADVVSRIPYLRALGVNAVELLPIMEFNETEWNPPSPDPDRKLCQYWGYSTVSFFTPMNRFARDGKPTDTIREFQYMVRELHRAGIEVILDVVYNHTAEMGTDFIGPGFYGMKQLAPFSYYILHDEGKIFHNYSGCGNTLNCNNIIVQDLIIDSLRYWAHDLGVDGFRFDLASILTRGTDGSALSSPPLIERIAKDAALRGVKLIAEPWDCGGLYQVGSFPHYGTFAEWNGKFRDTVRRFVRGEHGCVGEFATRLCGSQDLYNDGRRPFHSINFVTAHDGFTLRDLVSYNHKHNESNGENNRDGETHNLSWNCGAEGETSDEEIKKTRQKQIRNFLVALFVAAGTPMLNMGDEYGHTQFGNNNAWCQDGKLSWMDWEAAKAERDGLLRFTIGLIAFRKRWRTMQREQFLSERDVTWHGVKANHPEWGSLYNFLAMTLHGDTDIYVAFNCGEQKRDVGLPRIDGQWGRVVDTSLEAPFELAVHGNERCFEGGSRYSMASFSAIILRKISGTEKKHEPELSLASAFETLSVTATKDL